ncbi:hypothetical protein MKW92_014866 [Papaver armeniacum]|nr:hypothetical protein MKW92_014866 [Papaver armeniacum]
MWLSVMRSLSLASQEASGVIEGYHLKLKPILYDARITAMSCYWSGRYADEINSFQTVNADYIASSSWHRAWQILEMLLSLTTKIASLPRSLVRKTRISIVWNPGSDFSLYDCSWSFQGNLGKHNIKVNTAYNNCQDHRPSISFQSFRSIILSLWQKPMDDSVALDQSLAWSYQMLDQIQRSNICLLSAHLKRSSRSVAIKRNKKKNRLAMLS